MLMKDRLALSTWLRTGASLRSVEEASPYGLVENLRFTPAAKRAFKLLWTWTAPRLGGEPGRQHDRAYRKLGRELYNRRIERAKAWAERLS